MSGAHGSGLSESGRPPAELEASARRFEVEALEGLGEALDMPPFSLYPGSGAGGEEDEASGSVLSMHDWGFEEVQAFLQERPMSQYAECFEIVDGRVLSVLTDETLLELGVSKRLHRLVLINKIAKEKARSQQHAALHTAMTRLLQHLRQGVAGVDGDQAVHDRRADALNRRVNELVGGLPPQELALELKAKLKAGGALCELMLHSFACVYLRQVAQPKVTLFADAELLGMLVERFKSTPPKDQERRVNALRALFLLLRVEENKATAAKEGVISLVLDFMDAEMGVECVQVLGLAVLLALSHLAVNQAAILKAEGIRVVLEAVKQHGSCAAVQEHGFGLLWLFAQNPSNHPNMMGRGAVALVIAGMGEHRRRAGVQEHGCGLIRSLCFRIGNKAKIKAEGGIGAVVKGMVEHGDHAGVQEHGSAALRLMSANASAGKSTG